MQNCINRQFVLVNRPVGMPVKSDFKMVKTLMPSLRENQVLVEMHYISVDPYMQGRMVVRKSYVAPYRLGSVIKGGSVGKVIKSRSQIIKEGDYVEGQMGWQEYAAVNDNCVRKIDPNMASISSALGILGMTGLTAYFGLLDIGKPKEGETVVVSGAAGAVGYVVGQIAKIKKCRVVGIAGSDEKVRYLTEELGFDAAINYKRHSYIRPALKRACPDGVDVYFDNVGGDISDGVISLINDDARIAICGQISQYTMTEIPRGPRMTGMLLTHTALMKGFLVFKYADRYEEGYRQLAEWLKEGKLKSAETIIEGFQNIPKAFLGLFKGENIGKQIIKVITNN